MFFPTYKAISIEKKNKSKELVTKENHFSKEGRKIKIDSGKSKIP